jgi:hypothetical protein
MSPDDEDDAVEDIDPLTFDWRFGRQPIDWKEATGSYVKRYRLAPDKIEMIEGKLFWSEEERLVMVGLLLENLGIDKVMRLGDPKLWKEAAEALDDAES